MSPRDLHEQPAEADVREAARMTVTLMGFPGWSLVCRLQRAVLSGRVRSPNTRMPAPARVGRVSLCSPDDLNPLLAKEFVHVGNKS